jgi:hypothetical protein
VRGHGGRTVFFFVAAAAAPLDWRHGQRWFAGSIAPIQHDGDPGRACIPAAERRIGIGSADGYDHDPTRPARMYARSGGRVRDRLVSKGRTPSLPEQGTERVPRRLSNLRVGVRLRAPSALTLPNWGRSRDVRRPCEREQSRVQSLEDALLLDALRAAPLTATTSGHRRPLSREYRGVTHCSRTSAG